jgi:hypothetical protein
VRVAVQPVQRRRGLVALLQPLLHLLDLRLLRQVHPLREERDVVARAALRDEARHPQRLRVVVDHPAHELDVGLPVSLGRQVREVVLRQRLRRLPGRPRPNDVRGNLTRQRGLRRLRVLATAAAAGRRQERERDDRERERRVEVPQRPLDVSPHRFYGARSCWILGEKGRKECVTVTMGGAAALAAARSS